MFVLDSNLDSAIKAHYQDIEKAIMDIARYLGAGQSLIIHFGDAKLVIGNCLTPEVIGYTKQKEDNNADNG